MTHTHTDRRTPALFLTAFLLAAAGTNAQHVGNLIYDQNARIFFQQAEQPMKASIQGKTLVLEVNAMMNVEADSYLAIFNLTQLGQDVEEVDSLINGRIGRMTRDLKKLGIKEQDVFVDMLTFVPVYEYEETRKLFTRTYQEVPAGFEVQKNIHVRFQDPKVLDRIMTAAAREGIYDLVKVDYYVEGTHQRYDTLRTFARRIMKDKLKLFKDMGLQVDESYRTGAEKTGAFFPLQRYQNYSAHSRMSLNSRRRGQVVNDVRKPSTMFYNKVPYSEFELVLHPEITEPPVQFTYNLTLHLQLPDRETKKEVKETIKYLWLTPEGEVKPLEVG